MSEDVRQIFAEWSLPIWLTLSVVVTAAVYLRGWIALRRTRRAQFSTTRLACFLGGLGVLWLAIGSPMDGFADTLLSAHMIEHLLLMSAVPPLLLCGLPTVPLLRGLPRIVVRTVAAPLIRSTGIRNLAHWLINPVVAWLLMNISFLAWHVPAAYDFALEHENWHVVEHLCFLTSSILFWWYIIEPWPSSARKHGWGVLVYLISADVINTMLSATLAFCDRAVYPFYLTQPRLFGYSPLEDQVLGAAIMWVFGSFAFLAPALIMTVKLLNDDDVKKRPALS